MVVQMVVVLAAGGERTTASLPAGRRGCWRKASEKRLLPSAFGHLFLSWLFCSLGFVVFGAFFATQMSLFIDKSHLLGVRFYLLQEFLIVLVASVEVGLIHFRACMGCAPSMLAGG